jgi:hypothetical protein
MQARIFPRLARGAWFPLPFRIRSPWLKNSPEMRDSRPRTGLLSCPLHAVKVEAGIEAGIARVTVDAAYDAGRLDADAEALPALLLLGAKVELEALSGCFVGLSLDNVLDEAYFEYSGYPMPGLSATASLRWDL